jgi:serine protease
MRHPLLTLAAVCALLAPLSLHAPRVHAATPVNGPSASQARVIVKFKPDSALLRKQALSVTEQHASQAQTLGRRTGLALRSGAGMAERTQVMFASGMSSEQLAARLAQESDIEYAVPDQRRFRTAAPNDPLYTAGPGSAGPAVGQWYLRAPAGAVKSSIDVEKAWAVTTGSPDVIVAVLDTGVRFDHADLQRVGAGGNLLPGYDMIAGDRDNSGALIGSFASANDGDGRDADPSDPGDWLTQAEIDQVGGPLEGCPSGPENSSWHGTQTAGLIGAMTGNGVGMASVGRGVRVLPVRVLGKCGGYDSDIIAGMRWAAGLAVPGVPTNLNPAWVLNMSLGGSGACSAAYRDAVAAVNAAGAVVVASAGNSAGRAVSSPADCPGVIGVAALRHVGTKVGFSDLGPEISISAPGGNCINIASGQPCLYPILTTSNSGTTVPFAAGSIYTDSFNPSYGTSFSAPLVAGAAALILSAQPTLSPADVLALLQRTARPFPTTGGINDDSNTPVLQCDAPTSVEQLQCYCTTATCGAGMLDAGAAVLAAVSVQPRISVSPAPATAMQAVSLSAAQSVLAPGRSIARYAWTIVDGGGIVTGFSGATDGVAATVTPSAAGRFTVAVTVTDDRGVSSSASLPVDVAAASGDGGGGGALGVVWLALLALAVAVVRRGMRRNI